MSPTRTPWTSWRAQRRVIFRYCDDPSTPPKASSSGNPNGSLHDIAGVCSADGRVAGLMPHPEHAIDDLTGPSTDGLGFFTSVADFLGLEVGAVDAGRVRHGLATSGATR